MLRKRFWALLLVGCLVLGGCTGEGLEETALDGTALPDSVVAPKSAPTPEETMQPTPNPTDGTRAEASTVSESAQETTVSWKAISYGHSFFDLFIMVNGKKHYVGNFYGENLWQYEQRDAPEYISSHFRGVWAGSGSDFYIMRKSDAELAVMYYGIVFGIDSSMREWEDYDEVIAIPIEKNSEIRIEEPNIYKGVLVGADAIG